MQINLVKLIGVGLILILFRTIAFPQNPNADSSMNLPSVTITSTRLQDNTVGLNVYTFDSLTLMKSNTKTLADIFIRQTPVYINSYGPGNLATISMRGTSSSHTGFFWNGLSITSPNNGLTDVSLIPVILFGTVEVQHGGASSIFGGGNIGGSIHIDNDYHFERNRKIGIGLSAGSFNDYSGYGRIRFTTNKWITSTGFFYHQAKNDFPFINTSKQDNPKEKQQNSGNLAYGFMQQVGRSFGKENFLTADIWWQSFDRNIPAPINYSPGTASEKDKSFRTVISWKKIYTTGYITSKLAWFHDYMHYVDNNEMFPVDSKVGSDAYISETEAKKQISARLKVLGGIDFRFETGKADAFVDKVKQKQAGGYVALNYLIPLINWQSSIHVHQGWTEDYEEPFTPSLGFEGPVYKIVSGKFNISRNFRAPTFNERYWQPGGNINLQPELSWNEEASAIIRLNGEIPANNLKIILSAYNSKISNWIIWLPTDETYMVWQPRNIQKVWSRGLEFNAEFDRQIGKTVLMIESGYTYTRSTNEESIDNSYRKQLIYVPENIGYVSLTFSTRKSVISYIHHFTGRRFTTSDNSQSLPPYNLGYITLSRDIMVLKKNFSLQLDIDNIWNTNYQAVQYYPMPGLSLKFSLFYNIF